MFESRTSLTTYILQQLHFSLSSRPANQPGHPVRSLPPLLILARRDGHLGQSATFPRQSPLLPVHSAGEVHVAHEELEPRRRSRLRACALLDEYVAHFAKPAYDGVRRAALHHRVDGVVGLGPLVYWCCGATMSICGAAVSTLIDRIGTYSESECTDLSEISPDRLGSWAVEEGLGTRPDG